jgi:hypothetical protein
MVDGIRLPETSASDYLVNGRRTSVGSPLKAQVSAANTRYRAPSVGLHGIYLIAAIAAELFNNHAMYLVSGSGNLPLVPAEIH